MNQVSWHFSGDTVLNCCFAIGFASMLTNFVYLSLYPNTHHYKSVGDVIITGFIEMATNFQTQYLEIFDSIIDSISQLVAPCIKRFKSSCCAAKKKYHEIKESVRKRCCGQPCSRLVTSFIESFGFGLNASASFFIIFWAFEIAVVLIRNSPIVILAG